MDKLLTVIGTGKVSVSPDVIQVAIDIVKVDESYHKSLKIVNDKYENLKTELKNAGVDPADLKSTSFYMEPEYDTYHDEDGEYHKKFKGYGVWHKTRIDIAVDYSLLGKILKIINGVEEYNEFDVNFAVKNLDIQKNEALEKAIADAKSRAGVMAVAAGITLGDIVSMDYGIGENDMINDRRIISFSIGHPGEYDFNLNPDDIDIDNTVTITWEII